MRTTPSPEFNPAVFDADFFADYEVELAEVSIEDQAAAALADVLSVKGADGTEKTYEQIRDESRSYFASEWVQQNEALMNLASLQFAMACMSHPHGAELAGDSVLGSVFSSSIEGMHGPDDGHGHNADKAHGKHDHKDGDGDEYETDHKTGKKKKKKRSTSWAELYDRILNGK